MLLRKILFLPLIPLFGLAVLIRNILYKTGILSSQTFDIPVITVGNLSTGGTGKSPMTHWLAQFLLKKNFKPGFISRGYGRYTKGFFSIQQGVMASDCGDEPWVFNQKFPDIPAAVSEDRVLGIVELLGSHQEIKVVISDDSYQHRSLRASTNLLLTTWQQPFFHDILLPAGNLREFRHGASRADAVIVTRCPLNTDVAEKREYIQQIKKYTNAPVFFTEAMQDVPKPVQAGLPKWNENPVLLVSGIADASLLELYIKQHASLSHHAEFPDHYGFTEQDVLSFVEKCKEHNAVLVTTPKDYARLDPIIQEKKVSIPIYIADVQIVFHDEEIFSEWLLKELNEKPS